MKAMSCNTIFLLAVACCTLSVVMVAAGVDTRCSNYVCDLTNTDPSNYYDSSECDSVTCTSTCIKDDPAFEELLLELGAGTADRSTNSPVYLPITDWLSAQFPNQIFKILAMEVLGYQTRSAKMDDGWSILCCDKTVMWLETWPGDPFPVDPQGSLTRLPIGYTGFGGLYIPNYVMQAHPLASAYSAYKLLTEYQSLYPLTNTMPCNETLIDTSLGCVDDNRFCSMAASYWPNTSCVDGRYVPPQCVNNPDCQEIIYGAPIWDTGFFESVIKNLGLNFTFVYVGVDNLFRLVAQYALERRSFMFYMSGPDAILSKVPSTPLSLPPRTLWCEQTQNRDPTLSGANCSYDQPILYKTARDGDLAANPDLRRLFDSLQLSSVKLDALMAQHESGGGTLNVWDASCQWVRDNNATWKSWIVNTPPPSASSSSIIPVVAGVAGGVGAVIIIGVVLFFVYQRQMAMKSVENAPTTAPLALIFTDVESSTNLWEAFPEMAVAMEMHHALIRELIREYQCYEVKTIGDSFMIACNSLTEAVSLCVAIQRKLFNADWPQSLKYWKGDEENQPNMWHGLRVRAGVHWCKEVKPELDSVHGRYDYYGHDVNVSARVESLAAGGQTTMTEDTYRSMVEEPDYAMLAEDMICRPFCSGAELKGVQGTVTLYSLVPVELGGRVFKPLPNTTPCDDGAPLDGAEGDLLSSRESTVSHSQDNVTPVGVMLRKLVEDLLGYLGTPSDKDKALTELLIKNKLITDAAEVKRINFPRKVMMLTKHFTDIISRTTVQQIGAASMRRKPDSSGLYLHDMLGTSVMSSRNTVNLPALGVDTPTAHPNSVKN